MVFLQIIYNSVRRLQRMRAPYNNEKPKQMYFFQTLTLTNLLETFTAD